MALDRDSSAPATPDRRPAWRALTAEVLLLLLVVAAVEIGFRAYVDRTPKLALPRLFNSSIATAKYLAFRRAAVQGRRADIVIMGLSPMMVMNSERMGEYLRSRGRAVEVFNFAFPFHSIDFDRIVLRDIVLPTQGAPRLLIYGVMPFNVLYEQDPRAVEESAREQPGFQLQDPSPAARLRASLLTSVQLLLYREVIRDTLLTDSVKPDPWIERARKIDERGDAARLPPRPAPKRLMVWERVTYRPQMTNFQRQVRRGLLGEHIGTLGAFCRDHGIRLLVVNTAVSPFFPELLVRGRAEYDEFVSLLAAAASASGAAYLDLSGPDLGPAEAFVDSHHLNERAALAATERIAAFALDQGLLDAADRSPP